MFAGLWDEDGSPSSGAGTGIVTLTVTNGGTSAPTFPAIYPLVQGVDYTTSGSGTGSAISISIFGNTINVVQSIDTAGTGFAVNDTITVTQVNGVPMVVNAILTVTAIG